MTIAGAIQGAPVLGVDARDSYSSSLKAASVIGVM
jgi:hypothetical protein